MPPAFEHPALVIGGDGTLGAAVTATLRGAGVPVIATTRRPERAAPDRPLLDLARGLGDWTTTLTGRYRSVYLCAARSRLQECRADPVGAARINVERTIALADWLADRGAFVVFPSSSQVFNGRVGGQAIDHPVTPVTIYGQQKVATEAGILGGAYPAAVLRLSKVIHPGMPLLTGWIAALRAGRPVTAFTDVAMAPITLEFAVSALRALVEGRHAGLFQVSAQNDIGYFDVARHIAARLGADPALVRPALAAETLAEPLPARTSLDGSRLATVCGLTAPDPWASLDTVLDVDLAPDAAMETTR